MHLHTCVCEKPASPPHAHAPAGIRPSSRSSSLVGTWWWRPNWRGGSTTTRPDRSSASGPPELPAAAPDDPARPSPRPPPPAPPPLRALPSGVRATRGSCSTICGTRDAKGDASLHATLGAGALPYMHQGSHALTLSCWAASCAASRRHPTSSSSDMSIICAAQERDGGVTVRSYTVTLHPQGSSSDGCASQHEARVMSAHAPGSIQAHWRWTGFPR